MSDLSAQMDEEFMNCWKKLVEVSPATAIVDEMRRKASKKPARKREEVADGAHS